MALDYWWYAHARIGCICRMCTYRNERFRMVLCRASCDRLDRSSCPFWPCSNCVCELALPSSIFIEPAREFDFSIAAISNKQLKKDCFCYTQQSLCISVHVRFMYKIFVLFVFDRPQTFLFLHSISNFFSFDGERYLEEGGSRWMMTVMLLCACVWRIVLFVVCHSFWLVFFFVQIYSFVLDGVFVCGCVF